MRDDDLMLSGFMALKKKKKKIKAKPHRRRRRLTWCGFLKSNEFVQRFFSSPSSLVPTTRVPNQQVYVHNLNKPFFLCDVSIEFQISLEYPSMHCFELLRILHT